MTDIYLVKDGYVPLCAFADSQQAERFLAAITPKDTEENALHIEKHSLQKSDSNSISYSTAALDTSPPQRHGEKLFVYVFLGNEIRVVTRDLYFARLQAHTQQGKSDVLAVDLIHPDDELPAASVKCEYVSNFGPYWPSRMDEKWRSYLPESGV